jgi:hypothetical protein
MDRISEDSYAIYNTALTANAIATRKKRLLTTMVNCLRIYKGPSLHYNVR